MKRKKCFFQTAGSMGSSVRAGGEVTGRCMVGFAWLPVVSFLRLCLCQLF